MKRAFTLAAVTFFAVGCGADAASTGPAKTPDDAAPADAAADSPAAAPADEAPVDKPADEGADDAAWAGEAEAKREKAPAGAAKTETRTMEVIAQVVKENRQPVRDCFDKVKKDLPDLQGDMVIHFVVDPEGKVKKAELNAERSTIKSAAIVDCSVKVILGFKFPPSSRGMDTTVNYPFNFK